MLFADFLLHGDKLFDSVITCCKSGVYILYHVQQVSAALCLLLLFGQTSGNREVRYGVATATPGKYMCGYDRMRLAPLLNGKTIDVYTHVCGHDRSSGHCFLMCVQMRL